MGTFRRRIVIVSRCEAQRGEARAVLEDDFHHFRVALRHEFEHVVHVVGASPRHPYSLCPAAAGELARLVNMRLTTIASSVGRVTPASEQCTHLFDLAGLVVAAAARGSGRRQYDIEVPDRIDGRTRASIARDGAALLEWDVQDVTLAGPAPFTGVSLRDGMARWALSSLPADEAEAAIVLRRATLISLGRHKPLDSQRHAVATGRCFAQQPVRADQALRMVGSTWDFSGRAAALCADDKEWLAFAE